MPNIPFISGIPNVKSLGFLAEFGFKAILASTRPKEFQNLTVLKYMSGYNDNFMSFVSKIKWDFSPEDVGILAPRRGVTKKTLTVYSGTGDVKNVGKVYAIANQTKTNIWTSDKCNRVTGSDGVIYGTQLVQQREDLQVYLPNICRALPLVFDQEMKVNGMRSYRYKAPVGTFSSPETYPGNKFYCELKNLKQPHVDGVLDVSQCIDGNPPILISHPHFMEGDAKLFEHFEGLQPDVKLHDSFAFIHPRLSVPIYGVSRMQLNLRVNHFGNYFKNLPDGIILPLAWIETTTEEFPESIKMRLFLSTVIVDYAEIFFKFGSFIGLFSSLTYIVSYRTCIQQKFYILQHKLVKVSL